MSGMHCDIIIPVWNQPAFTKDCIESIFAGTSGVDHGIIIIDNASDEKTRDYLKGLAADKSHAVSLIRNEANLGFIKAVNQGMNASRAPFVCLLNNDTIVTKGWLKEMIAIAQSARDMGLVNPSSNNLGQKPSEAEPLEHYAEKLRGQAGRSVELGAAIGFCMLIKREVLDKIGLFDEVYGMGNFEDTDFSRRAVKEGYRCVRACGAYVYHRENTSFKKMRTFDEDFRRNREIFEFRWGKPKRVAYVLDACDTTTMKRLEAESMRLARGGHRVWYFLREDLRVPAHSNIMAVEPPGGSFYAATVLKILVKKKRFDEIYVGSQLFGNVLRRLSFIHRAEVKYY